MKSYEGGAGILVGSPGGGLITATWLAWEASERHEARAVQMGRLRGWVWVRLICRAGDKQRHQRPLMRGARQNLGKCGVGDPGAPQHSREGCHRACRP